MKISMMSYTIARQLPKGRKLDVKALCEFTRELKLDAVDWCGTYGHDPREIRKTMDDYGLKTVCYTYGCDLNFRSASERAPGRDVFKKGIETAVALGADKIMLPVAGKQDRTREESFRNWMMGLNEVIDFAGKAGVTVTIENFPSRSSPFIASADMNRAVKEIPKLRITFDNGNVTTAGETARDGFIASAKWVIHSHFKDWKVFPKACPRPRSPSAGAMDTPGAMLGLDGKCRRAVLVGDGDVDQVPCLKAMKEYGYKGYINFEYEGNELTARDATIEGVRRMREWMASL